MNAKFVLSLTLTLTITVISGCLAIPPNVIPLGLGFDNTDNTYGIDGAWLDSLRLNLGLNFCHPLDGNGLHPGTRSLIKQHNLDIVPYMTDTISQYPLLNQYFQNYLNAHYMVMQAEDEISWKRFLLRHGAISGDGQWFMAGDSIVNDTARAFIFLDDLWYNHEPSYGQGAIDYKPFLRMKIVGTFPPVESTVAFFKVWGSTDYPGFCYENRHHILVENVAITIDSFSVENPRVLTLPTLPENLSYAALTYQIVSTGICSLAIDWLKVCDNNGKELIEDTLYNATFRNYASQDTNAIFWHLRDDMRYDQLLPARHMDSLIYEATNHAKSGYMKAWLTADTGSAFIPLHDFLDIAKPTRFGISPYPFWWGSFTDPSCHGYPTLYYGADTSEGTMGLQWALNGVTRGLDSIIIDIQAHGNTTELWYGAQQQYQVTDACPNDSMLRRPTGPEMSCEAFMALSYGIKRLWYWPLGDEAAWGGGTYGGVMKREHVWYGDWQKTDGWTRIQEHVTPNLQALDSFLVAPNMVWEKSYSSHQTDRFHYLSSIHGWSDTPNPDTGWAQIGEFHNGSDKYILLVNRACSMDNDGTEAPDQHFFLGLNPATIGSNYVFITDLADSLRHAAGDTGWVGIPQTTYSARMPDGTIPYTITLKAGEGKLLKIVATTEKVLSGNINTSYTYQGRFKISDNAIIPSATQAMRIVGPARIEVARCDTVKLIINGRLSAIGTPNDSILFVSDTTIACIPTNVHPLPGDWYGIVDKSSGADTMLYCAVRFAYDGFRADTNSNSTIKHSEFSRCENNGIYYLNTGADTARLDSSFFKLNGNYDIYAAASLFLADGNTFLESNEKAAILISDKPHISTTLSHNLTNNFIRKESGGSAPTGVKIQGQSGYEPSVELSGNKVRKFSTGIFLYRCATGGWGTPYSGTRFIGGNEVDSNTTYGLWCDSYSSPVIFSDNSDCSRSNSFSYNSTYGMYCTNTSSPKVKLTFLKSNSSSNVCCATASLPNLGDSTSFYGGNWFVTANYDIKNGLSPLQVVKAMGNYWGETNPDATDFYPTSAWTNYRHYLFSNPCAPPPSPLLAGDNIPTSYSLRQNYPNPFNPTTTIEFDLPQNSWVSFSIYNILGQKIRTLADGNYPAGAHQLSWDGRDDSGNEISSGVYFYLLETDNFRDAKKMLVLR